MKQIEAHIMGQAYVLACPEDAQARMARAVQRVDAAMCGIRDAGKIRARERIAVLAALNIAFAQDDAAAPANATAPAATALEHPRLQALLQRVDSALAQDGRLL